MKNTFLLSYIQSANHKLILASKNGLDLILMLIFSSPSPHCTSVLTLPFNHFLCDCLASCSLYFVRLKCNVLKVCIGRPMQPVSPEASFHLKWARKVGEGYTEGKQATGNGGRMEEKLHLYF